MFFSGKFSVLFLNGGGGGGAELAILLLQAALPVLLLLLQSHLLKRNIRTTTQKTTRNRASAANKWRNWAIIPGRAFDIVPQWRSFCSCWIPPLLLHHRLHPRHHQHLHHHLLPLPLLLHHHQMKVFHTAHRLQDCKKLILNNSKTLFYKQYISWVETTPWIWIGGRVGIATTPIVLREGGEVLWVWIPSTNPSSCVPFASWRLLVMLTALHLRLHMPTVAIVMLHSRLCTVVSVALSCLLVVALLFVHSVHRRWNCFWF